MQEVMVTYCDWCGEKIDDSSYTSVRKDGEPEKDFHSYSAKCIEKYNAEEHRKYQEERKRRKEQKV